MSYPSAFEREVAPLTPDTATAVQRLIETLHSALEQTHDLWASVPAQSALAAQFCAVDQTLQRLVWQTSHLLED